AFANLRANQPELRAKVIHRQLQAVLEAGRWIPAELRFGKADVRTAAHRVVRPRRLKRDSRRAVCKLYSKFRELEYRELVRIAEVDRSDEVRLVHHPDQRFDDIVDVGKRTRLLAVSVNHQIIAAQRGDAEIRNHAAVINSHSRPVGVEQPDDLDVDV